MDSFFMSVVELIKKLCWVPITKSSSGNSSGTSIGSKINVRKPGIQSNNKITKEFNRDIVMIPVSPETHSAKDAADGAVFHSLRHFKDRGTQALILATGYHQIGDLDTAKYFMLLAIEWGCDKKLVAEFLISSASTSIAHATLLANGDKCNQGVASMVMSPDQDGGCGSAVVATHTAKHLNDTKDRYCSIGANERDTNRSRPSLFGDCQLSSGIINDSILYSNDGLCIEYFKSEKPDSAQLAFVFSPSMNRQLSGNPYGGDLLIRDGYDVIAFKSSVDDWFQRLPSEVIAKVNAIAREKKYTKRLGYGSSMGGYAAIAFSNLLNIDVVLALSPQYSISESYDTRWSRFAENVKWRYVISPHTIAEHCKFYIVYDDKDADREHIERFISVIPAGNISLLPISFSGHPVTHFLNEVGLIKSILRGVFSGCGFEDVNVYANRKRSRAYLNGVAQYLLAKGKYGRLLRVSRYAATAFPEDSRFHRCKSIALDKLGELDDAIEQARAAVSCDEKNPNHYHHLSGLLGRKGLISEAIEASDMSISLSPDNAYFIAHKANLLKEKGCYIESVAQIELAIAKKPKIGNFHRTKSIALDKLGKLDEAIEEGRAAIRNDDKNPVHYHYLSGLLVRRGLIDEAIEMSNVSISLSAENAFFIAHKANLLKEKGRYEEAVAQIELAIAKKPKIGNFHRTKSIALDKLGKLDEAIEEARAAVNSDENCPIHYHYLSTLLVRKGLIDEAIEMSNVSISLAPGNAHFIAHNANLLRQKNF